MDRRVAGAGTGSGQGDAAATVAGLISVVMPCHNAQAFVAQAVDSVIGQTYPDVELIVVDDGSTDGSVEILRRYGGRLTLIQQRNQGPYPARNRGVAASRGEFLAFLDADDWWEPDALARLHDALANAPGAAVAYCGWQNVGVTGGRGQPFVPPDLEGEGKIAHLLKGGSPWPIHAALLRRSAFDSAGGFRTGLATSMDYDLWLRIAATHGIVRVAEVLARYRFHDEGQISSQPWRQVINGWRIKRDFLSANPRLAAALSVESKEEWLDRTLVRRGYQFLWQRDLRAAQKTFRFALRHRLFRIQDLQYVLPALLPLPLYSRLVRSFDGETRKA